jgi:hypothetical protein
MKLKKMAWLLVVVIAVLAGPVTKIQNSSTVGTLSVAHDGAGPGAHPIPL